MTCAGLSKARPRTGGWPSYLAGMATRATSPTARAIANALGLDESYWRWLASLEAEGYDRHAVPPLAPVPSDEAAHLLEANAKYSVMPNTGASSRVCQTPGAPPGTSAIWARVLAAPANAL